MKSKPKIKVQAVHRYNASPEQVYETLLDPEKAKHFMFATLTGKMIRAEIDAKVGGGFVFVDRRQDGDASHFGEYLKLDRPKNVTFKFAVQKNAPEMDVVSINIIGLKQGCEVTLTHEITAELAHLEERVREGWDGILDGLGAQLRSR